MFENELTGLAIDRHIGIERVAFEFTQQPPELARFRRNLRLLGLGRRVARGRLFLLLRTHCGGGSKDTNNSSRACHTHFTVISTDATTFSHSSCSLALFAPALDSVILYVSTGAAGLLTVIGTRPRSCALLYSVPHWHVCLLMMSCHGLVSVATYKVYFPLGTVRLPIVRSASVENAVALFAPARHTGYVAYLLTWPPGPKILRPRIDGAE